MEGGRGKSGVERERVSRRRGERREESEERRGVEGRGSAVCFFVGIFKVVICEFGIGLQSDPRDTVRENWTCGN